MALHIKNSKPRRYYAAVYRLSDNVLRFYTLIYAVLLAIFVLFARHCLMLSPSHCCVCVPFRRTSFAIRSYSNAAPLTWNSLSPAALNCDSLSTFKSRLKTRLLSVNYSTYMFRQCLCSRLTALRCYINFVLLLLLKLHPKITDDPTGPTGLAPPLYSPLKSMAIASLGNLPQSKPKASIATSPSQILLQLSAWLSVRPS